jgi:hypothetical protein
VESKEAHQINTASSDQHGGNTTSSDHVDLFCSRAHVPSRKRPPPAACKPRSPVCLTTPCHSTLRVLGPNAARLRTEIQCAPRNSSRDVDIVRRAPAAWASTRMNLCERVVLEPEQRVPAGRGNFYMSRSFLPSYPLSLQLSRRAATHREIRP